MRVAAGAQMQMEVEPSFVAECLHKVLHQLGWKVPNPFLRHRHFVRQVRAAAPISTTAVGFVQRRCGLTKAAIAQRLPKGAARQPCLRRDRRKVVTNLRESVAHAFARSEAELDTTYVGFVGDTRRYDFQCDLESHPRGCGCRSQALI